MPHPDSPETISHLPNQSLVERTKLMLEILDGERVLESLRNAEMPLREELASQIGLLRFACEQSAFRIRTNQYRDGRAGLDDAFAQVRSAENVLVALLDDIRQREAQLADMRATYNDVALWETR
jgi:hypothetical protein